MNCSGEEQERLLSLLEQEGAKKKVTRPLKDERNGKCFCLCLFVVVLIAAVWLTIAHLFTVNLAFTAQDCFQKIDRRLRATLRRKQIPMVSVISSRCALKVNVLSLITSV